MAKWFKRKAGGSTTSAATTEPKQPTANVRPAPHSLFGQLQAAGLGVQSDHYIIRMIPPAAGQEIDEIRRQRLITEILNANGYLVGSATVDFQLSEQALSDDLYVFTMMAYRDRTGKKVDMNRCKVHNFSGNTVRGKMLALFLS
jgi:hypothetical protein